MNQYTARPAIVEGDLAKIPLGVGAKHGYALVDKEYAYLDRYKWSLNGKGYVVANFKVDGGHKTKLLARIVTLAPSDKQVDHKNHDKLDNRTSNLRVCTAHQNGMNKSVATTSSTGYSGVTYVARDKKYQARIGWKMQRISLGAYSTALEAARAYNSKARELYGEFAHLNKVVG